jgi:tetratricopeptide (TPR) repeat protein
MLIRPEPAKAFSAEQECELTRQALRCNPGSLVLRSRLAQLLNQLDAFDETIALLTPGDALGFHELRALAWAHWALGGEAHRQLAVEASERAFDAAASDRERAVALCDQARSLRRLGKADAACELLRAALELDPHISAACERLAAELLRRREAGAVVALTDQLSAGGVGHAALFAARAAAFAQLGEIDRARETVGLAAFLYHQPISPPAGWDDLASFNAALADELLTRRDVRYNRYGVASEHTWRVDSPAVGAAPAVRALLALVAETAERHSAELARHPWVAARPERASLRSWCVITRAEGFEQWHMHPDGWMSGGYYVEAPASVAKSDDGRGCLVFGLPPRPVGEDAARAFGELRVRPQPGSLTLFPSHAHHRTYPHGDAGHRICIAFDIRPD